MSDNIPTSHKSKTITLVLCIVFGVMGIHDFYVGKIGMGIIKMLTGNFFLVGYILDIIKICSNNYKDGAGVVIRK